MIKNLSNIRNRMSAAPRYAILDKVDEEVLVANIKTKSDLIAELDRFLSTDNLVVVMTRFDKIIKSLKNRNTGEVIQVKRKSIWNKK